MQRTTPRALLVLAAALAAALVFVAVPDDAEALDLQVGAGGRVGGATIDTGGEADSNTGFGGGARIWAALKFIDFLAVGANFDFAGSSHSLDGGTDLSIIAPSVGAIVRSDVAEMFAFDFWVNYAFGTATFDTGAGELESDLSGVHLGVDAFYRFKIGAYKTWIEAGPYFSWGSLEDPDAPDGADPTSYLGYGLAVQGTFEFGL